MSSRRFFHCISCDLIHVPRLDHLDDGAQRARYALHDNSPSNTGYVAMLSRFVERFGRLATPQCRIVDIGCGPNQVLVHMLRDVGFDAVGHDPLYGIDGFGASPFDAIVATETVEHFISPFAEFDRMARALRPGGLLAITTQFHRGPESVRVWWYARDPTHVSLYSRATMGWIAHRFDFDFVECDDGGFCAMRRRGSGDGAAS